MQGLETRGESLGPRRGKKLASVDTIHERRFLPCGRYCNTAVELENRNISNGSRRRISPSPKILEDRLVMSWPGAPPAIIPVPTMRRRLL